MTDYRKLTTKEREIWGLLRQLTAPRERQHDIVITLERINADSATRVKQFLATANE